MQSIPQIQVVPTVSGILDTIDYVVIEWNRDLFPNQIYQVEVINNGDGTYDVKDHIFIESTGESLFIQNEEHGISRSEVIKIVKDLATDQNIDYIQAEFKNKRIPILTINVI